MDDVSLDLDNGEILGIVGESGAGKSTIGNAVIGLLQPPGRIVGGRILLTGQRIDTCSRKELRRIRGRRIGMIFQDPMTSLDPLQTIKQQLVETIDLHLQLGETKSLEHAIALLKRVDIPDPEVRIDHYPHQFSGGMRQRVVIALALCAEPEVIIADEPSTALDVSVQAQIMKLLRDLCIDGQMGMILVTHDMGVIAENTDRVAVMYRGKLVETGTTRQVLSRPQHPYSRALLNSIPRPDIKMKRFITVSEYNESETPSAKKASTGIWNASADSEPDTGFGVFLSGISKSFILRDSFFKRRRRWFCAVSNVSVEIRQGEVFGMVGESGSGKSTLARIIAGLIRPDTGSIRLGEAEFTSSSSERSWDTVRTRFQMIFQDPYSSLNPRMRVLDIIAEPIRFHGLERDESKVTGIVHDLLDHVSMPRTAAIKFPHEFSGGQRQRIAIARALATHPKILICDEPTSALDVSIQAQILNLLKDIQESLGLTILFISHDLPVIRQMCDRVGVMRHGQLCEVAETDTLFNSPSHDYTRHLLHLMPKFHTMVDGHQHSSDPA